MKYIRLISRLFLGSVFLFSGFVKAIDPLGYTYKIQDYFEAFGMGFFDSLALPLAIFFSLLELVVGFMLFTGLRMKVTAWVSFILMVFFTGLTLVIAFTNPVKDCGCFGDAIILTNWQTFWKNVILFIPAAFIFAFRQKFKPQYEGIVEWLLITSFTLAGIFLSVYCYNNLPIIDFRPYKIGANITEGMRIPPDAEPDQYETVLIYEKDGIQQEFAPDSIPWQDTTWKWVETKSVLVKKGYEPPIHDFAITAADGFDYTESLLSNPGYSFMLVSYGFSKADKEAFIKANELAIQAMNRNHDFICVTSSTDEEIAALKQEIPLNFQIYTADEITLKTIVRSNPGLLIIKEGTVINKFHHHNFPTPEELEGKDLLSYSLDMQRSRKETALVFALIFLFLFAICAVGWSYQNIAPSKLSNTND